MASSTSYACSSSVDLERFAQAVGVEYRHAGNGAVAAFTHALGCGRATIVEVVVGDSNRIRVSGAHSYVKESVRRRVGPGIIDRLKRWLR